MLGQGSPKSAFLPKEIPAVDAAGIAHSLGSYVVYRLSVMVIEAFIPVEVLRRRIY
jgi:hypothetical protein